MLIAASLIYVCIQDPLLRFKYHALEHADTLLLAAQVQRQTTLTWSFFQFLFDGKREIPENSWELRTSKM